MITDVVLQHVEEAAMSWQMRDRAVSSPIYDLSSLTDLDLRVEHNLDGARIAGQKGWDVCQEVLPFEEPGEVFVAAGIALGMNSPDAFDAIKSIAAADSNLSRALSSAIGWLSADRVETPLKTLLTDEDLSVRRIGIAAASIRRIDVKKWLGACLVSEDPLLKQRSLQAAGELGRIDLLKYILDETQDEDPLVQFHALIAARLLGDPKAADQLLEQVGLWSGRCADSAVITAIRGAALSDSTRMLRNFFQQNKDQRLNIIAVGAMGDSRQVDWLIRSMRIEALAKVAGEAFSMITGVDLLEEDLDLQPANNDQENSDPAADENVDGEAAMEADGDEDLPVPDAERVQDWWQKNSSKYPAGNRFLLGRPIDSDGLKNAIISGNQRQREAAAIEYAIAKPDSQLFETRMPGFLQKTILAVKG